MTAPTLDGVVLENRKKDKHPHMQQRVYRKALDQHGRQWGAEIDGRTNDPVGPIKAHFSAPWFPVGYVRWVYDDAEGRNRVVIDYAAMKADRRHQLEEWKKLLLRKGLDLHGNAFDPENPSPSVLAVVGGRPEPVEIAIRAERGDAWLLGQSAEMPAWAGAYFMPADVSEDDLVLLEADGLLDAPTEPAAAPKKRGRPPTT